MLWNWKTMEHEGDNYTNGDWCFWYNHQNIIKGTGGVGNNSTSGNHPNYTIENGQKPSKLHYWEWPEYWEESGRHEETCHRLNSSERPSANTDVKK